METMLRVLIADDEPIARQRLRGLLAEVPDVEIVAECEDGMEAADRIAVLRPDLAFLDIEMPEMNGFEVLEAVGVQDMPTVVFVTAYDEFALRAFNAHAIDYVMKPLFKPRLETALERARGQIAHARENADTGERELREGRLEALLSDFQEQRRRYPEKVAVRVGPRILFVDTNSIDWIGADGNYVGLHVGKQEYLLRETMARMEQRLDPDLFMRIHRSTIVNTARIREVQSLTRDSYVFILHDGTKLTSAAGYRQQINELIAQYS